MIRWPLAAILLGLSSGLMAAEVELHNAWVRALPPTQSTTAAYLTIANRGPEPIAVTGASAGVARRVEIHTTREVDGMVRMERLQQLVVESGAETALEPGGTHLMLLDLERMPAVGENVSLCLELSPGGRLCVDAPVRSTADADAGHHHHQE